MHDSLFLLGIYKLTHILLLNFFWISNPKKPDSIILPFYHRRRPFSWFISLFISLFHFWFSYSTTKKNTYSNVLVYVQGYYIYLYLFENLYHCFGYYMFFIYINCAKLFIILFIFFTKHSDNIYLCFYRYLQFIASTTQ